MFGNNGLKLGHVASRGGNRLHREGRRGGSEGVQVIFEIWGRCRIAQEGDPFDPRRNLLEYLQPLVGHRWRHGDETSDIAARARNARYETAANRICNLNEHDRGSARLLQQCRGRGRVYRKNKFGLQPDEFFRESSHRLNIGSGPARLDPDIAALRPPELFELLPERRDDRPGFRGVLGKVAHQHPDGPHALVLLRPRRERPRSRGATKKCDELAPS